MAAAEGSNSTRGWCTFVCARARGAHLSSGRARSHGIHLGSFRYSRVVRAAAPGNSLFEIGFVARASRSRSFFALGVWLIAPIRRDFAFSGEGFFLYFLFFLSNRGWRGELFFSGTGGNGCFNWFENRLGLWVWWFFLPLNGSVFCIIFGKVFIFIWHNWSGNGWMRGLVYWDCADDGRFDAWFRRMHDFDQRWCYE